MVEFSVVCVMNLLLSFGNSSVGVNLQELELLQLSHHIFFMLDLLEIEVDEKDFGRIQKDRIFEMNK
jgi:hypothetical protein